VKAAMTTDPDHIRARVSELLSGLPDVGDDADIDLDLDALAQRLGQAHDVLVQALESVEKG
jgi:hypothetical protein